MPNGLVWYLSSQGGYFANPKLSRNLRKVGQPKTRFRQFVDNKEDFGKSMGDTLDFNKVMNIRTAGGALTEGVAIPKSNITITRGTTTATEYGNAIGWTSKFETLSEFDTNDPIQGALVDDNTKTMDRLAKLRFAQTRIKYIPTGTAGSPTATWEVSTSGTASTEYTATTTATRDVALWDLKNCVDALERGVFGSNTGTPVSTYDGQDYVGIFGVQGCRAIYDDPDFDEARKFGDPEGYWNGEIGRVYRCRITKENHLLGALGSTSYTGEGFIFGSPTVMEIDVIPDEVRRSIPGDFGREMGMAWYNLLGMQIIWPGNLIATTEPMATIIHITSA